MVDFILCLINTALYVYVSDPEPSIQEHAMALVRNLIDGCEDSIEYAFAEDGIILNTICRQLQSISRDEIGVQVSFVLFSTFECDVCSKGKVYFGEEKAKKWLQSSLLKGPILQSGVSY